MNADGSGVHRLTHGKFWRGMTSFSPDGKRIIYARSELKETSGVNRVRDRDIYVVDIVTGVETQLTNYRFYMTSGPQFMPDGERFIFEADPPGDRRAQDQYKEKYQNNQVFVMDGINNKLIPIFENGEHSGQPSISLDGSLPIRLTHSPTTCRVLPFP